MMKNKEYQAGLIAAFHEIRKEIRLYNDSRLRCKKTGNRIGENQDNDSVVALKIAIHRVLKLINN